MTRLAKNTPPSEVRDALRAEYGVEATLDQIVFYNPDTVNGAERLSDTWKELFYQTRERWLKNTSSIPAAHKAYRIRDLAEAAEEAKELGNYVLMAKMHEQIAKEMGGAFTNVRLLEHSGRDGRPIETRNVNADLADTDDPKELMRRYEELFADE